MRAGAHGTPRVVAVGADAEVCAALHGAVERAGLVLWCLPTPADLEPLLRLAAPQLVLLVLPAAPDASWGTALAAAAGAARVGVRVVVVAPSREVVEPLAAVAGAERAVARAELLASPESVLERRAPGSAAPPPVAAPAPATPTAAVAPDPPRASAAVPPLVRPEAVPRAARPPPDLATLIDEELEGDRRAHPRFTRVEVNVSLVSEHNFYVGATRRFDSGGVFISTAMPPPVGTPLQVRLGLADGRKLDLDGEVAFIREKSAIGGRQPSGCGVRLSGVPGWAVEAIDRFVQARPPIVWHTR